MDVSNDREVERLGANATAVYALEFWNKVAHAAREDGLHLDPLWEDTSSGSGHSSEPRFSPTPCCSATTGIVLTASSAEDRRLHKRFRSNFSLMDVKHLASSNLVGERWQSLLIASEGIVDSYNFMTLMRLDAFDIFWMNESEVSDGLSIVPRAQFLFIEATRIHEGVYATARFRRILQLWDTKCQSEELMQAIDTNNEAAALHALALLRSQWPFPRISIFKESNVVRTVKAGWKRGPTERVRTSCLDLLQFWNDLLEMGKLARTASRKCVIALDRAARALAFRHEKMKQGISQATHTKIASLHDLTPQMLNDAPLIFSQHGIVVLRDYLDQTLVQECKAAAYRCMQQLIDEQLKPRGLAVDGSNAFDFAEVRQRPGYRVDNRYKILESPILKSLSKRLLQELPTILNHTEKNIHYNMLYAGVVHSFPRANESDAIPEAQVWHRDGPSLFETSHHETHCFNIFVPLIDVSTKNGTTEFIPGSHIDATFERCMEELLNKPNDHPLAVKAEVDVGGIIVFDVRLLHRGLANASMEERPMLYFTVARPWFQDEYMFDGSKRLLDTNEQNINDTGMSNYVEEGKVSISLKRLYELVAGQLPPMQSFYGHPHYTARFDLLLSELSSNAKRAQNIDAILKFCASGQQDIMADAFIDALCTPRAKALKRDALQAAQHRRREHREAQSQRFHNEKDSNEDEEDFSSIAADMDDVSTLYSLTATLVLKECVCLRELGFSVDQDGVCCLLATLKAHALRESSMTKPSHLEEAFTAWWHAGIDRFEFSRIGQNPAPRVLVVFSSLGSGIARPEWGGSLSNLAPSEKLDVLYVLDPAFSWYCQDPTCSWKGGEFYFDQLKLRLAPYESVLFLGDSMGAAAALRFSSLANSVLAFSPQVDISSYEAITRSDFSMDIRRQFTRDLIRTCLEANARIVIHYSENCADDAAAVELLPHRQNIEFVAHKYDDHTLSLYLREVGTLQSIIADAIALFLAA